MSYKAVIFDLDGTILDTLQDLANSVNHALRTHGYPERTLDEVRGFIGNGIRVLMRRSCPADISEAAQEEALATFRVHYDAHCKDFTGPYGGIHDLLAALKERGIRTAVVSNKIEPAVIVLCDEHFPGAFEYMVGNRPDLAPKPSPDSVNEVIEKMGLEALIQGHLCFGDTGTCKGETILRLMREHDISSACYIGDTLGDQEAADYAGIPFVHCTFGFGQAEHCIAAVDSFDELLNL